MKVKAQRNSKHTLIIPGYVVEVEDVGINDDDFYAGFGLFGCHRAVLTSDPARYDFPSERVHPESVKIFRTKEQAKRYIKRAGPLIFTDYDLESFNFTIIPLVEWLRKNYFFKLWVLREKRKG